MALTDRIRRLVAPGPAGSVVMVVLTLVGVAVIEFVRARGVEMHSPGAFLTLFVVLAGLWGGVLPGLVSAGIVLVYLLHFHTSGSFEFGGPGGLRLLLLILLVIPFGLLSGLIGAQSRRARDLIARLESATGELNVAKAQQEREAGLKGQILNGLNAHVALLDSEGRVIAANDGWLRTAGSMGPLGEQVLVGGSYPAAMRCCEELRGEIEHLRAVLSGSRDQLIVEFNGGPSGKWFRASVRPVDLPEGRGAVVMHSDITEQRRAQEELKESRSVLEQAQRVARVGSWIWEPGTDTIDWSPESLRIFGLEPGELDGTLASFERHMHPEDRDRTAGAIASSVQSGAPLLVEHRIVRTDGEVRWVQARAEIVRDSEGRVVRLLGVIQDITDRKLAQDGLAESERRHRLLFDINPLPIWVYDRETLRLLAVNNAAVRHYGYTREELMGKPVDELFAAPEHEHAALAQAARYPARRHIGWRHLKKDGSIIDAEVRTDEINFEGRPALIAVITDVTQRRRTERLLGGQNLMLGLLATGAPLAEVLETLAQSLTRQNFDIAAAVMLLDERAQILRPAAMAGVPDPLASALATVEVAPGVVCCGDAAHARERVIVESISADPRWERLGAAAEASGMRACWSQPILGSNSALLGTLALYIKAPRKPQKHETKLMETSAYLAGIAIERTRSEQALRTRERLLRLQMEQMPAACIVQTPGGEITQWNPAAERIFGWKAAEVLGANAIELLVPEDQRASVKAVLSRAMHGQEGAVPSRNSNRTRSGDRIICEWQNGVIHDENQAVIGVLSIAQDVTERLAGELALRRSEELNQRIIDNMPGGLVQVGLDGRIIKANTMAQKVLGYTYDQLASRFVADFEPETIREDGGALAAADYPVSRCLRSGKPEGPETIGVRRPDGETAWGVYTAIPIFTPAGVQDGAIVTFVDITERRKMEEALRESEERLRFAQECASAGTWDWDVRRGALVWSDSCYELMGVDPSEQDLVAGSIRAMHPDDAKGMTADVEMIRRERRTEFRFEFRVIHPRRGTRWLNSIGRCVFEDGELVRMAGLMLDLTELKAAQEALARSEERYRRLAVHGAMGIWEVSRATGETIFANPALCRMIEVDSPDDLRGADFRTFFTAESLRTFEREVEKRARGEVSTYEVELVGRHGGRRQVMLTGAPATNPEHGLRTLIGTFTDITDRKAAEEALRQAQKLDAVGRLASGIAHDFNNLLTAIFGYTSLARRTLSPNHPATRSLDRVDQAAQQASGVTKSLLTFTRQERSEKRPVQLGQVVLDAVHLLRRTLPAGIDLRTAIAPRPVWIYADVTQINQILINLAINARDAMPEGGRLTISVDQELAPLDGQATAPTAVLSVSDTGAGMTPDLIHRIFEPFFTTKPAGEGTGLGLPIIHGIVQDHGGAIKVESVPGSGTTFRVLLPVTDPDVEKESERRHGASPAGNGELLLLADDRTYVREIMASMLLSLGYRVAQAGDGPALLDLYRQHAGESRLFIIDSDMPGFAGTEALSRLRAAGATEPAILLSDDPESQGTASDPESLLLRKPFQMTELAEAIGKFLHPIPST